MTTKMIEKVNEDTMDFMSRLLEHEDIFVTDNIAMMKVNRTELAEATGRSERTVTRVLDRLEKYGAVKVEYRRGRNGGYVIGFNPTMFEFEGISSNILTNPTEQDTELVTKVFSETRPHRVKGDMLTEGEYRRYQAEQKVLESKYREYNAQLAKYWNTIGDNMIPWEFFEQFGEDTERYYKAYILSKTYDTIAVAWDKYVVRLNQLDLEDAEGMDKMHPARGWNNRNRVHMDNYHSLRPFGWFGSNNWNTALKLVDFFDNEYPGLNPVTYISALFEQGVNYQTWKFSNEDFTAKILFPHMRDLSNVRFKGYYDKRVKNQDMTVRMYGGLQVNMLSDPRIMVMSQIWEGILNGEDTAMLVTSTFENYDGLVDLGEDAYVSWGKTMQQNYDYIKSNLEINADELEMSKREIDVTMKFVSDNFAMAQGKLGTEDWMKSPALALAMTKALDTQLAPTERKLMNTWFMNESVVDSITGGAWGVVAPTGDAMETMWGRDRVEFEKSAMGHWIESFIDGNLHDTMSVLALAQQRKGVYTSLNEVQVALQKASRFVKLDSFGLLEF